MNKIIHGDCLKVIPTLDDSSIDLLVTSPPYNVDLGNNKFNKDSYNEYDDNRDFIKYIKWLHEIFACLKPKMKDDGRLCINIGDQKNGQIPTHFHIVNFMIKCGYNPYTTIIWNKKHTSNRSAWGSWLSPSCPSFPTPFEYILVFYNKSKKKYEKGETDLTKKEFVDSSSALWEFPGEKKSKNGHPAPFPLELPTRLIKQLTWVGDTVLDIFAGSGTTGQACQNLKRNYILIEDDELYIKMIEDRLNKITFNSFF